MKRLAKKAEMSMNMIIMAVIAIIILAIVVFLIARSGGDTNKATACPSKGGICTDKICTEYVMSDGQAVSCPNTGSGSYQVCCNPLAIGG
jgi:hypothetical protein